MWKPPVVGALAGFAISIIAVIIQAQQASADVHNASHDNDMAGMVYWFILPAFAIEIIFATIVGAAIGWIYVAIRQEKSGS